MLRKVHKSHIKLQYLYSVWIWILASGEIKYITFLQFRHLNYFKIGNLPNTGNSRVINFTKKHMTYKQKKMINLMLIQGCVIFCYADSPLNQH